MPKFKKMPDFYHAKIWFKENPKIVRFAKIEKYDSDAEAHWKDGNILCADAVTGEPFLVPNRDDLMIENQPFNWRERDPKTGLDNGTEYDRYVNEAYKKALKAHKAAGEGVKKDKLLSIGVADGSASYVIVKVNAKTVKIEWRAFSGGDDYVDRRWGYQSTISKDEAKMYMRPLKMIFR